MHKYSSNCTSLNIFPFCLALLHASWDSSNRHSALVDNNCFCFLAIHKYFGSFFRPKAMRHHYPRLSVLPYSRQKHYEAYSICSFAVFCRAATIPRTSNIRNHWLGFRELDSVLSSQLLHLYQCWDREYGASIISHCASKLYAVLAEAVALPISLAEDRSIDHG